MWFIHWYSIRLMVWWLTIIRYSMMMMIPFHSIFDCPFHSMIPDDSIHSIHWCCVPSSNDDDDHSMMTDRWWSFIPLIRYSMEDDDWPWRRRILFVDDHSLFDIPFDIRCYSDIQPLKKWLIHYSSCCVFDSTIYSMMMTIRPVIRIHSLMIFILLMSIWL